MDAIREHAEVFVCLYFFRIFPIRLNACNFADCILLRRNIRASGFRIMSAACLVRVSDVLGNSDGCMFRTVRSIICDRSLSAVLRVVRNLVD